MSTYKSPQNLQSFHQTSNSQPGAKEIRLVVIGDSGCGKTSLLINFKDNKSASYEDYIPTIFDTYNCFVTNGKSTYKLSLHDTAGQEDFEGLRTPIYSEIDMVIACYSIDSTVSLTNIQDVWIPEVQNYKPDVPIVLVATKSDLKNQLSPDQVVAEPDEKRVAASIGKTVVGHIQASALTSENVKKVFDICIAEFANRAAARAPAQDQKISSGVAKGKSTSSVSHRVSIGKKPNADEKHGCCVIV